MSSREFVVKFYTTRSSTSGTELVLKTSIPAEISLGDIPDRTYMIRLHELHKEYPVTKTIHFGTPLGKDGYIDILGNPEKWGDFNLYSFLNNSKFFLVLDITGRWCGCTKGKDIVIPSVYELNLLTEPIC